MGGHPVNSTARWTERLEHATTLLRAEGTAVLSLRSGDLTTLFTYRIGPDVDWTALVGPERLRAAMASDAALTAAIAAGRWGDQAAYAVLAAIERDASGASCLVALRHSVPFDVVEVAGAYAAARLLASSIDDGRKLATAERAGGARRGARSIGTVKRAASGHSLDDLERTLATDLADELARAVDPGSGAATAPAAPTVEAVAALSEPRVETLRILAVEDHPVMRIGIRTLLERDGLTVVALTATAAEAVEQARQGLAAVALVDLNLPDAEGVDVIERLHEAAPDLPIVAFSVDGSADRIRAALRAGAIGYLNKGTPAKRVIAALRAAAAGLSALGPEEAAALVEPRGTDAVVQKEVARSLPAGLDSPPESTAALLRADQSPKDALSARELELLKYLAEGYTNKEIARALVLAEDTVKKAVQTLIAKLGATDRTHAVVLALRSDLIQ